MSHFKIREGEDLNIMDGVRAIAMMWVVFGHAFSFSLAAG
jgi:peptidoglycan/LPS O-acetylase OafA/YrhL